MPRAPELLPRDVLRRYAPHGGTLWGLLTSRAAIQADRAFLIYEGQEVSWREFQEKVERTVQLLRSYGVSPGDRVAVMAENSADYVAIVFATMAAGAIFVPINPDLKPAEAEYIVEHAEPAVVFASDAAAGTLQRISATFAKGIKTLALAAGLDQLGQAHTSAANTGASARRQDGPGKESVTEKRSTAGTEHGKPDDTGLILYTSGTTGFPKGVMHSQQNMVVAGEYCVERLHLQPEDRMLCILPFFHINALIYSLMGAAVAGASLVIAPRFSASGFWKLAADTGATQVNIIAAVGRILMRRPRSEFIPGHKLRKLYGAPITPDIYRAFQNEFGIPTLIEGYGLTETPCVCSNPYSGPQRVGSIGIPTPHPVSSQPSARMRIADASGRDVAQGTVGELMVQSPIAMQGYYRDPQATAAVLKDGWFRTGDLVKQESDGYYTFVARQKDIIRRRGENISGAELDEIVSRHPDIQAAAAIPVESELGEDEILIAAVKRPQALLTEPALRKWCEEQLSKAKLPRFIVFVDELPYTPSHRVAKFQLRNDASLKQRAIEFTE